MVWRALMAPNQSVGFVLTKKSFDNGRNMTISLWLKTSQGAVNLRINDEQAIFFVEENQVNNALKLLEEQRLSPTKTSKLPLKTFNQLPVEGLYFDSSRRYYQARELLKFNQIKCYEDDIRPEDRYLMERFITDVCQFNGSPITHKPSNHQSSSISVKPAYEGQRSTFPTFTQVKCKKAEADITLKTISLDLECSPKGELYSIGLYAEDYQCVMMVTDTPQPKEGFDYIEWLPNEKALLVRFLDWVQSYDPDVFIGWNVIGFDFNLLQKRYDLHGMKFSIGRDNSSAHWRKQQNGEQKFLDIEGRVVLDGIDLLKTATYNFPSFSLDNVARELLGKTKKVDDVENRLTEIIHNFHHDKHALAAYNLEDCKLVWEIFEHTKLLDFAKLRAKLTGLSLDRIGGSVAAFTNLYLPKLHRAGYVAPNMGDGRSDLVSPGGYVMDSIPGLYRNVLVLDFKSLYPSIIRTFFIDPMGMVEGLKESEGAVEGFDGAYFSRTAHFLPAIIDELWAERDKAKKEGNGALSQAIKIIMNSFYGVLGSTGCRFFDPRLSGSITKRGHEILKTTKHWIEDIGYKVIYGDTDSIFVHIGEEHELDTARTLGKELEALINEKWTANLILDHQIESRLEIEFETHFSRFFMPTIRGLDIGTKKRYAGLVENVSKDNESMSSKLVFKGLETVRTDWTQLAKDFQQELYRRVFHNEPIESFVLDTFNKTKSGELDEKLIYRKRIRRKLEDYQKNVPPHIKAARLADEINVREGIRPKYQNKGWISYVMTLHGPQAIEHQTAALDYQLYIDRQLKAVADAILPFVGLSFDQITKDQLSLF